MTENEIEQYTGIPGVIHMQHSNGNEYVIKEHIKLKVPGQWSGAIFYQGADEEGVQYPAISGRMRMEHVNGNEYVIKNLIKLKLSGQWGEAFLCQSEDDEDAYCIQVEDLQQYLSVQEQEQDSMEFDSNNAYVIKELVDLGNTEQWCDAILYHRVGEEDLYARPIDGFNNFIYLRHDVD